MRPRSEGPCRRCGRVGPLKARGLDESCYAAAHQAGQLEQYPLVQARVDLAEADRLEEEGRSTSDIALHQNVTPDALRLARWRRRQAELARDASALPPPGTPDNDDIP
uniref:hypothetical protein n=1 Tax=Amycolatopsis sp. CA-096443 TaxID=3239919 RepID=UPI003F498B22